MTRAGSSGLRRAAERSHYNASLTVAPAPDRGSDIVWVADFLPDALAPQLAGMIDAGMAAIKRTLDEAGSG